MSIFSKNLKFKFYSSLPAVTNEFPILPASSYKRKWVPPVAAAYKNIVGNINNFGKPFSGVVKCPGIFNFCKTGWIVTSWFDFIIDTVDDGKSVGYRLPPTLVEETTNKHPVFGKQLITFMNLSLSQMQVPKPPQSLDTLIKISTPWAVEIPKGWSLLLCPVGYSDEIRFTSSTGILRRGDREIKPQLFWHQFSGTELVKAGTPLCQLIPIPDDTVNFDFECLDYTPEQVKKQDHYFFEKACKFLRN